MRAIAGWSGLLRGEIKMGPPAIIVPSGEQARGVFLVTVKNFGFALEVFKSRSMW